MLSILLAAIGMAGFGMAGYLDLKTTEFPDWLPYSMIALAIAVQAASSFLSSDWSILMNSAAIGVVFLGLGLGLYFLRQWGDGDAWLLGALGFLFPTAAGFPANGSLLPFPMVMLFNFFAVAFAYVIAYSVALSLRSRGTWGGFVASLKKDYRNPALMIAGFSAVYFALIGFMLFRFGIEPPSPAYIVGLPLLIAFVVVFFKYGMYIEGRVFKRRIHVSKLRAGDVPVGEKWRVLKQSEVNALKKRGGYVWIKEGVRFAPVFFLTLLATLLLGSIASLVFGFA
jgi:Flp pilus assembly protein protease CpaA